MLKPSPVGEFNYLEEHSNAGFKDQRENDKIVASSSKCALRQSELARAARAKVIYLSPYHPPAFISDAF
jgi:hypothetical protein